MIMAIQTVGSVLTCIPSLRGHSRSAVFLGLIKVSALKSIIDQPSLIILIVFF